MARIFFAVDVHGATGLWKKWLRATDFFNVDVLMLCGDLTGKALVPLVEDKNGYILSYYGRKQLLKREQDVKRIEEQLSLGGLYVVRMTQEEVNKVASDRYYLEEIIRREIVKRMKEWMDLLINRIDLKKTTVMVMPGNDDDFAIDNVIKEYQDAGIIWPLDHPVEIAGIQVASMPYTNPTPWNTPREVEDEKLPEIIDKQVSQLEDPKSSIFNFHAPPYGTRLDLAPELKPDLSPVTGPGGVKMIHVGSKAVLEALRKYKPLIGLHGHIHESAGEDYVEGVPVINPGSEYGENILRGVIIQTSDKKIDRFWRVEG
ncbi:MAG: metallophosphoesterase family protein [Fervidobacterium sp.]